MNNNGTELKTLIFSTTEIWAALFSQRVDSLVMFEDISAHHPKDEEMIYALRDMVKRELMEYADDKVRLTELGKKYFAPFKAVSYCFFENSNENLRPTRGVYFSGDIVRTLEADERKQGYFKLSAETIEMAAEDIFDLDFIPKDNSDEVEEADNSKYEEITPDELKDMQEILYMIDRYPVNMAERDLRIVIKRGNVSDSILLMGDGKLRNLPFDKENMKLIYRMAGSCSAEEILNYDFS